MECIWLGAAARLFIVVTFSLIMEKAEMCTKGRHHEVFAGGTDLGKYLGFYFKNRYFWGTSHPEF